MDEILKLILNAAEDKKAIKPVIIDIREISIMADYFFVCSGSNINQVKAICDNIDEKMRELKKTPNQIEGYDSANWILMDYGDYVIHVFDKESRDFYNLERIWGDGKIIS